MPVSSKQLSSGDEPKDSELPAPTKDNLWLFWGMTGHLRSYNLSCSGPVG